MTTARWYPAGQTRPSVSGSPWDVLIVHGGTRLPGRARVKTAAAWKADEKRRPGSDADRPTLLGFDPQPVEVEIACATTGEVDAIHEALSAHYPAPGREAKPVQIGHPSIDHLQGIKHMLILRVSSLEVQGGLATLRISGRVWVASPKPARDGKTVRTPTAPAPQLPNARRRDAERRGLLGSGNPDPKETNGYCAPTFTPGGGS